MCKLAALAELLWQGFPYGFSLIVLKHKGYWLFHFSSAKAGYLLLQALH